MSAEKLRELKTLASVCPELNMANYTEDDVRHLNDWAIEMSLLVEQYALSQQPDNTARKSVRDWIQHKFDKLTHQAPSVPATSEPVLTVEKEPDYWSRGHFHEGQRPHIDPTKVWKLPIGTKLYTHPAPGVPDGKFDTDKAERGVDLVNATRQAWRTSAW